jgi:hypothetical protein
MQHLEASVMPVIFIGRTVLKGEDGYMLTGCEYELYMYRDHCRAYDRV